MTDYSISVNRTAEATERRSAMKHTPGPWRAWDDDGTGTLPCVLAKQVTVAGNFYVAQCSVFADALLIAAAPKLLDALRESLSTMDALAAEQSLPLICEHAREVARAAIAEATSAEVTR